MSGDPGHRPETRKFERVRLYMPGRLSSPAGGQTMDCKVLDLSAGGAAVKCDGCFAPASAVVLDVASFGRFEGRVVAHQEGVLRLAFVIARSEQNRLKKMLAIFGAESRQHKREPAIGSGFITRADGRHLTCDVLDVSLEGVSIRTKERPAVGEIVALGRSWGKVVREHEEGVAIHFVQMMPDKSAKSKKPPAQASGAPF